MIRAVEATVDSDGVVHLPATFKVTKAQRVIVTVIDDDSVDDSGLLMSEKSLAEDWLNEDEDKAWAHLD